MTPEQTKKRIAVMAKHGEPGWRIEVRWSGQWQPVRDTLWRYDQVFRAVHIEKTEGKRVPLPWITIKCGMVIRDTTAPRREMTVTETMDMTLWCGRNSCRNRADFTSSEYIDGNEWKPLWTEEPVGERIVEVISEEEVRFPASKEGIL